MCIEAKPRRAVRLEEVRAAIIPNNISSVTKNALQERGVTVIEYETGNDQSRIDALNSPQVQEVTFSERAAYTDDAMMGNAPESQIYSYGFLVKQPDMTITTLPDLNEIMVNGRIEQETIAQRGKKNAMDVGRKGTDRGNIAVEKTYTGHAVNVTNNETKHGIGGDEKPNLERLFNNSRAGSVSGDLAKTEWSFPRLLIRLMQDAKGKRPMLLRVMVRHKDESYPPLPRLLQKTSSMLSMVHSKCAASSAPLPAACLRILRAAAIIAVLHRANNHMGEGYP